MKLADIVAKLNTTGNEVVADANLDDPAKSLDVAERRSRHIHLGGEEILDGSALIAFLRGEI